MSLTRICLCFFDLVLLVIGFMVAMINSTWSDVAVLCCVILALDVGCLITYCITDGHRQTEILCGVVTWLCFLAWSLSFVIHWFEKAANIYKYSQMIFILFRLPHTLFFLIQGIEAVREMLRARRDELLLQ